MWYYHFIAFVFEVLCLCCRVARLSLYNRRNEYLCYLFCNWYKNKYLPVLLLGRVLFCKPTNMFINGFAIAVVYAGVAVCPLQVLRLVGMIIIDINNVVVVLFCVPLLPHGSFKFLDRTK